MLLTHRLIPARKPAFQACESAVTVSISGRLRENSFDEHIERIELYVHSLQSKLVTLIGQALADLKPARLGYAHARAGFAMNRGREMIAWLLAVPYFLSIILLLFAVLAGNP